MHISSQKTANYNATQPVNTTMEMKIRDSLRIELS